MSDWSEVLADKMMSEFYKGNRIHGFGLGVENDLHWVPNYTNVIAKGNWEKGVLRVLKQYDHLEVVRHWIYIIKMFVPKVEDHYTEAEWKTMQRGI